MNPDDSATLQLLRPAGQDELFNAIDQLRDQGMGAYVSLPQLIVCGNQSSGKSSVLEAISGVPFPTNDGLCTRFATELMLRRSSTKAASVNIKPGPNASSERKTKLESFTKKGAELHNVPKLIEEAKSTMSLKDNKSFCDDVLQVEMSGPDMPHLTLVDLPGLLEIKNDGQTEKDVEISKQLVQDYAEKPRSIILAVIEASHDHVNQAILRVAQALDPEGFRTLGIITKPDIASISRSNVSNWVKLAKNESTPLRLGWHVLKNANGEERQTKDFDRDDEERNFFRRTPEWKTLSSDKVGVQALRPRLSQVLSEHIRDQLPELVEEIELQLQTSRESMRKLGPARPSSQDQRLYLTELGGRFQFCTRAALAGDYTDPYFKLHEDNATRRLRTAIRSFSEEFARTMSLEGHKWEIVSEPNNDFGGTAPALGSQPNRITRSAYVKNIQGFVREHKGRELPGTFNPILVGEVFIRNSEPWETLAKSHVEDSWNAAKDFVNNLLDDIADRTVGDAILRRIIEPAMEERLQALYTKIDELMKPFKRAYPMTHNPLFVSKIQFLRKQRAEEEAANGQEWPFVGDLESMDYHACSELLDCMLAYYDVALHVFVDNVTSLAVENCLLDGLEDLLSPYRVAAMADDELQELAAEAKDVREFREREQERRRVLDSGLATCHRHVKRKPRHFSSSASSTPAKTSASSSNGQTNGTVLPSRPKAQAHSKKFSFGTVPSTTSQNASSPGFFSNLGVPSNGTNTNKAQSSDTQSPGLFSFSNNSSNSDSAFGSSGATAKKPRSSGNSIFAGASTSNQSASAGKSLFSDASSDSPSTNGGRKPSK